MRDALGTAVTLLVDVPAAAADAAGLPADQRTAGRVVRLRSEDAQELVAAGLAAFGDGSSHGGTIGEQRLTVDDVLADPRLRAALVASTTIREIVSLRQSAYDALPVKDPATLYVITDPSPPTPTGPAKVATLREPFTSLAGWTVAPTGKASIIGGTADLVPIADTAGMAYTTAATAADYDLTSSAVVVQVAQLPAGGDSMECEFMFGTAVGTNAIGFVYSGGALFFRTWDGGAKRNLANVPYDPVAMRFWRIRHDGATLNWETSPDNATWTSRQNEAASNVTWVPSTGKVILRAGYWNTAQAVTADARFEAVNP